MKELKDMIYHDDNYDIDIRSYLTAAEIEAIANVTVALPKTYAVRRENIYAMLLHFCVDITDEQIEEIGIAAMTKAGLIDTVITHVFNYDEIDKAIAYKEQQDNAMLIARQLQDMEKKNVKKSSKK